MSTQRSWPAILEHAAAIVESYETGVTLRQLFYRLVADQTLENTRAGYSQLSDQTARARRAGTFPDLLDRGRLIHQYRHWVGPDAAREWLGWVHRRDMARRDRPAVLLYGGDFDPSGENIDRDFVARADCWACVVRVALSAEQVAEYQLPPAMGKATDSRAAAFVKRHGNLCKSNLTRFHRTRCADCTPRRWRRSGMTRRISER